MSPFRLALRNFAFHWRSNCAVALGVLAATAVLTGALVVGDSVRGSLRHLAIERLGRIDSALVTTHFFHEAMAGEVAAAPGFQSDFTAALPAILLQGTLESTSGEHHRRGGNVALFGVGPAFWKLGDGGPKNPPGRNEIILNQPLAEQLHVGPPQQQPDGSMKFDEVILRLPQAAEVPADSPLGRKTETVRSRRLTVSEIIPANGLGRFGLRPTQQTPLNAFTSPETLQQMLGVEGRVNAILVAGHGENEPASVQNGEALQASLHPTLADYGVSIHQTDHGYFNLTSDRMLLEPAIEAAVMKALAADHPQPVFTYLANYILAGDGRGKIPYSTVAAVDFTDQPPLGPLVNRDGQKIGPIGDDEIVLNSWAADDLAAQGVMLKPGDPIELTYFESESTHGNVVETKHQFQLKEIAKLEGAAADRALTPEVKGVTDEASIADWNPPFPFDHDRVRSTPPNNQDDLYWRQYKATPKAFVNLEQGRKLWGSRFGNTTSIRIPPHDGLTEQSLTAQLESQLDPATTGFQFLPVKRLSLTAAAGTTPFAVLFLAFSMFIIASALMLLAVLFKLGVDSRAAELGITLAVGFRRRLLRRMMLIEGGCVALAGALAGVLVGIAYAWLMLVGLKTWWLGAISTPFLELYVRPESLAIGYLCGVLVSLATIVWALRQTRRVSVRRLLAGQVEEARMLVHRNAGWAGWIAAALAIAAAAIAIFGARLGGESQAGAFFSAGALILVAGLIGVWQFLRNDSHGSFIGGRSALLQLAIRNGGRHPLRSTLTIGLTAAACFLIIAVSAFQLAPPSQGPTFDSGDGGFGLIAQADQPIYQNLNSPDAQYELGFSEAAIQAVKNAKLFPLRVQAGDDASCLNLYQPRQPRVLGAPQELIDRGGFDWAASDATTPEERKNPWLSLSRKREAGGAIPVVLDQNTAMYSLHLYGGVGEEFEIDSPRGGKIKLQVVGLLANSIFQGDLIVSEENFERLFPDVSGYRFFLVTAPQADIRQVANTLDSALGDYGFTAQTTAARLETFFAVQNTYLSTFRSLGGLGLLLGTIGLAAAQLRSVVERRGELALMQACGFRRRRLSQMILLENSALLLAGLAIGVLAALVVLIPHLIAGGAGIPWLSLAVMLGIVLLAGLLAGAAAARAVMRSSLVPALRGG
jgi:putative ABC transport system permease protein